MPVKPRAGSRHQGQRQERECSVGVVGRELDFHPGPSFGARTPRDDAHRATVPPTSTKPAREVDGEKVERSGLRQRRDRSDLEHLRAATRVGPVEHRQTGYRADQLRGVLRCDGGA